MSKFLTKKNILITIIIFIILRISLSLFYYNYNDLITINIKWVDMIRNYGLFNIYQIPDGIYDVQVDYPPLLLIWFGLIEPLISFSVIEDFRLLLQLLMKSFGLIFDIATIVFLYKKFSPKAALLWTINLAVIINSSMWGQIDSSFAFFTILMFYYMKEHNTKMTCFIFALNCLAKLQGVYLLPILLLFLINEKVEIKEKIKSLSIGLITGILFFLPFIIANKDILLPFKIYLGGATRWAQFNRGAANFLVFLSYKDYSGIWNIISPLIVIMFMVLFFLFYKKTKDIYFSSTIYLYCLFMCTFSQQERYGFYTMVLLLITYIIQEKKEYLWYYLALMVSVASNQIMALHQLNYKLAAIYDNAPYIEEINSRNVDFVAYALYIAFFINILIFLELFKKLKKNKNETKISTKK